MRAAGLVCLGAGAGLIRADLRAVRGTDITARSGGVIVTVRSNRPRMMPVLGRYHDILLESARFADDQLVTGGTSPGRRNVTNPLARSDDRPAHLTRVHAALTALPEPDQARLGVMQDWHTGPHRLTCRQVERTFKLVADALRKDEPDGAPSSNLAMFCDDLLEASIPAGHKDASTALAADWTDVETWSRPPRHGTTSCADPEASWGHRNSNLPGPRGEMFFGYYLSATTTTREEDGPAVPELARRMTLTSCGLDPARALVPVLQRMADDGTGLGDILADSG